MPTRTPRSDPEPEPEPEPSPEPEPEPSEQPYDPFNPETLRIRAGEEVETKRDVHSIPVRKPKRDQFFRVRPELEFQTDTAILEHDSGRGRETYLVSPHLREEVRALTTGVIPVRLFTAITKRGSTFLWPARLWDGDTSMLARTWYESALSIAEDAKTHWVKMVSDQEASSYFAVKAFGDLGQPQWLDLTFRDLIFKAFRVYIIDSLEHPVIREINGEE
jgi:hypothetical protein